MAVDFPFCTDGCSGGMSWTWRAIFRTAPPWEGCCVRHDIRYWAGGTAKERAEADRMLRDAVRDGGHPVIAWAMWIAVRLGGVPWLPISWRWGYGWDFRRHRFYEPLGPRSSAERSRRLRMQAHGV